MSQASFRSSRLWLLGLVLLTWSCRREEEVASARKDARVVTFEGTCDASAVVELGRTRALVADDENNLLRVYDVERGGKPELQIDVSASLGLREEDSEVDLEASTRVGDRAYFLTSHARTKKGKRDPDRLLFFSAELQPDSGVPRVLATSQSLLDELIAAPGLAHLGLAAAAERAPKEEGGLNLEGLTHRPDGGLWLGFRSPVPNGRALLVGLLNPDEVLEGKKARFTAPLLLDLGGLGVRALSHWRSSTLILAGPTGEGGPFKLFRLRGSEKAEPIAADLSGFNTEGIFADDSRDGVLLMSDDGSRKLFGKPCKKLKDPKQKSFRAVWVQIPK